MVVEDSFHFLFQRCGLLEPGGPVDGEGMMQRGDDGDPQQFPQEHSIAQTLVVMEDIKAVVPGQFHQFEEGSEAEGLNLRKDA